MPPTDRPGPVRAPEALIRRLAFHGRHLPPSTATDADLQDPERCRKRLRMGGRTDPLRFLPLLTAIRSDPHIPDPWAVPILQGIADRLLGNQAEEPAAPERSGALAGQPPSAALAGALREWLAAGSPIWNFPRTAADAILAAISRQEPGDPFADPFAESSPEPNPDPLSGLLRLVADSDPEIPDGPADAPGGVRGRAARAAVRLAALHGKAGRSLPPFLENLLFRLAADRHPAVLRALVRALSEPVSEPVWIDPDLARRLFRAASRPGLSRILPAAEPFLQVRMTEDWPLVGSVLQRMKSENIVPDADGWAFAVVRAVRSGKLGLQPLAEALVRLPMPETGLAILESFAPQGSAEAGAGFNAPDLPLFIALTEIPTPPPPLADRLVERFSEAATVETVPLDALFRMAYNLLKMLDRTSGAAERAPFYRGLAHLAQRAPRMGSVLLEAVREAGEAGAFPFSPAERETANRIAGRIDRRVYRADGRHPNDLA